MNVKTLSTFIFAVFLSHFVPLLTLSHHTSLTIISQVLLLRPFSATSSAHHSSCKQLANSVMDETQSPKQVGEHEHSFDHTEWAEDDASVLLCLGPAAQKVIATYELLENILIHLPMVDVLLDQRVSRSWQSIIERSVGLQEKLFFKIRPSEASSCYPPRSVEVNELLLGFLGVEEIMIWRLPDKLFHEPNDIYRPFETSARPHVDLSRLVDRQGSWRKMLLVQPQCDAVVELYTVLCLRCQMHCRSSCVGSRRADEIVRLLSDKCFYCRPFEDDSADEEDDDSEKDSDDSEEASHDSDDSDGSNDNYDSEHDNNGRDESYEHEELDKNANDGSDKAGVNEC